MPGRSLMWSANNAYTVRKLRRQIRPRSPAMVSNTILLKALPREIPHQARKRPRPSASVVGVLKSRVTKFVVLAMKKTTESIGLIGSIS